MGAEDGGMQRGGEEGGREGGVGLTSGRCVVSREPRLRSCGCGRRDARVPVPVLLHRAVHVRLGQASWQLGRRCSLDLLPRLQAAVVAKMGTFVAAAAAVLLLAERKRQLVIETIFDIVTGVDHGRAAPEAVLHTLEGRRQDGRWCPW